MRGCRIIKDVRADKLYAFRIESQKKSITLCTSTPEDKAEWLEQLVIASGVTSPVVSAAIMSKSLDFTRLDTKEEEQNPDNASGDNSVLWRSAPKQPRLMPVGWTGSAKPTVNTNVNRPRSSPLLGSRISQSNSTEVSDGEEYDSDEIAGTQGSESPSRRDSFAEPVSRERKNSFVPPQIPQESPTTSQRKSSFSQAQPIGERKSSFSHALGERKNAFVPEPPNDQ